MSAEGHFCEHCGCGIEHGCVCGNCDDPVAPDLPMRERIAEALAHTRCRENNPKADHPRMGYLAFSEEQRAHLRAQQYDAADAVLAVLADLPDTAVEAGAEATRLHRVSVEHDGDYGEIVFLECRCGWGPSNNGDTPAMWAEAYAHENQERQAAVFAAIKEGKA